MIKSLSEDAFQRNGCCITFRTVKTERSYI